MNRKHPILTDAMRLQQQRQRQQQDGDSLDILQNGHENPAKAIRAMLDDCARRAQQHAGTATADALAQLVYAVERKLASKEIPKALALRHPDAADGQSYLQALFDAVSFLYMRVTTDASLDSHWILKQQRYLVTMIDQAIRQVHAQHSISKHHFKLVRLRPY
ncbi:hypothetical protein OF846_002315 [Rhodotorula toruloides]|nr:hypothetical protein OF846_002315 [Rhodotorula toruloides]